MDFDDFRSVLQNSGIDVWTFIDTAIGVCVADYADELKIRRDGIVERLYTPSNLDISPRCKNCDHVVVHRSSSNGHVAAVVDEKKSCLVGVAKSGGVSPQSVEIDEDDDDEKDIGYEDLFDDDEQTKILTIKEHLEDPQQETDIGRHVNRLRKHSSNHVRSLVKQLVRKWKDMVDEWVRLNPLAAGQASSAALVGDGDSPQQKVTQNGHHQVPDFACSPILNNGRPGSDKYNAEPERKIQANGRRETPTNSVLASSFPASAPPNRLKEQKEKMMEVERLASARKRLQDNYKEAEKAKKQRTIQVMGIHEIPKSKNTFFAKNRGGSHGRQW